MDLTDQQWHIVQPIINAQDPQPSPRSLDVGGRPPIHSRLVLDAILWKLRNNVPWSDLPDRYPSYQTCYLSLSRTPCGRGTVIGAEVASSIES